MILRDQMPSIIQFNRTNANLAIGEYRMHKLEAAAKEAIQQSAVSFCIICCAC